MSDNIKFLTGTPQNLEKKSVVRGQVYFTVDSNKKGQIVFDAPISASKTERITMSENVKYADSAGGVDQTAITASDYTNWRTLIFGASNSGTEGFTPTTQHGGALYATNVLSVQPSTGTIRAKNFKTISGNFTAANTGFGLYLTDSASNKYAGIYDNGTNLWIGATSSDGMHHKGSLFLSTGYTGTIGQSGVAASTGAYLSFPTFDTSFRINGHTSRIIVNGTAGSATMPVFINSNGQPTAITSYEGNAATASKFATARKLKVALGSTTDVTFDGSADQTSIPISGTLGTAYGGTGKTSWTVNQLIYANSSTTLAQIAHASSNSYVLRSGTSSAAPSWIQFTNANTGSTIVQRDASGNFSAGTITAALSGNATTATTASKLGTTDVGSGTKGIYLKAGVATAMTYSLLATVNAGAANRLSYYSGTNAISQASSLYTTGANLGINATTTTINSTAYTLYVNGNSYLNGTVNLNGKIYLKASDVYGDTLPTSAVAGQIFFKKGISGGGAAESASKVTINDDTTSKLYVLGATGTGALPIYRESSVYMQNNVLYGAAWNDYAECRETYQYIEPGRCVCENGDGTLSLSYKRLQSAPNIVSDTFGFIIGKTEKANTPLAVSGRVLVYTYEDRNSFKAGDVVCSGPKGTVSKMTREEIQMYPDKIVGIVSEIPHYSNWGEENVKVRERIWIKVK